MRWIPEFKVACEREKSMNWQIVQRFPNATVERAWRECLTHAAFPAHYVSPELFHEPFFVGKRPFAVLAMEGAQVIGVLSGIHDGNQVVCGLSVRPQVCVRRDVAGPAAATKL